MPSQQTRIFLARGTASRGDITIPMIVTGSYKTIGHSPVECRAVLETDPLPQGFDEPYDPQNPIELKGVAENGQEIWARFRVHRRKHALRTHQHVWEFEHLSDRLSQAIRSEIPEQDIAAE